MPKITNKSYRQFLDDGIIKTLDENDIKKTLTNIKGRHTKEGRALLITLYYTGARPNEILKLRSKDIKREKDDLIINLEGSKRGLPRPIYLNSKNILIKELWQYATGIMPDALLFYNYTNKYTRTYKTKNGETKTINETTDKVRYHIKKWFANIRQDSLSPYFLRHNRFSKLAEQGATDREIQQVKGSKTPESVQPYLHMSTRTMRKLKSKFK